MFWAERTGILFSLLPVVLGFGPSGHPGDAAVTACELIKGKFPDLTSFPGKSPLLSVYVRIVDERCL